MDEPIAGLAFRTPQEVFDIMVNRIKGSRIGQKVRKRGGDYEFDGEIVAMVTKKSGAIRYVVEDDRGLLLIMNERQVCSE